MVWGCSWAGGEGGERGENGGGKSGCFWDRVDLMWSCSEKIAKSMNIKKRIQLTR